MRKVVRNLNGALEVCPSLLRISLCLNMFKLFCKLGYGGHLRVRFIDILDTQLRLVVSFLASEPDGDAWEKGAGQRGRRYASPRVLT